MTRQALYRRDQLAAGKCGRGCGQPRFGHRTTCKDCNWKLRIDRSVRWADEQEDRRMTKPRAYDRVVKGRSPKQIEAAKQYSATATSSWWIGLDRQALNAQAAEHQRRMRLSKYGRLKRFPE
jgi:hypothetical protein